MSKRNGLKDAASPSKKQPTSHLSPEQAEAARESEMIDNLNRDNIHQYLRNIEVTSLTEQMARGITRSSADKVTQGLRSGVLQIARNPPPLPDKAELRLSSEEAREAENRAKRENMSKKIDYLYEQIRGESPKEHEQAGSLQVDFKEILSKEEHERRVREMVQEKLERKKRAAELQEESERKRREEEERQAAMRRLEEEKQKEMKRLRIQESLKKRKEEHDKSLEVGAQLQKQLANAKNRSRLYEEMEQRYQSQVLLPSLEEKKSKLKEIRDFHKRYDVETIKDHEKQYLQKSFEKSQERRAHSPEWKYHPPSHTDRLSKQLREEEVMLKEQLESRRKKLDEMQKRQELYRMELKEKHQPVVDEEKRREIEERLIREKHKYDKMHPDIDKRKLGEAYLEIAKRMKRPESVKEPLEEPQAKLLKQQQQSVLPRANHTQQFYEQARRRKMESIVNSQQRSVSEKYLMLKMEAEKLGEKLRQKEELARQQGGEEAKNDAAQLLLSSIKAKMGIIDLLKPAHRPHSRQST